MPMIFFDSFSILLYVEMSLGTLHIIACICIVNVSTYLFLHVNDCHNMSFYVLFVSSIILGCAKPKACWHNLIGYHIPLPLNLKSLSHFGLFEVPKRCEGVKGVQKGPRELE